jgi:pyrrolysine biosynthesis protein PylD
MTRLRTNDIAEITRNLDMYDDRLRIQTGRTLKGIACLSVGIGEDDLSRLKGDVRVGVIPFSCGQGIIQDFSETVAGIIKHLGFPVFVADGSDVAAMADACRRKADIFFMADERCFVAVDLHSRCVINNAEMTGRGFAVGLALMVGSLMGKKVLVVGCGAVGSAAVNSLLSLGADVAVYDENTSAIQALTRQTGGEIKHVGDLDTALMDYDLLFDASPATDIIRAVHINEKTFVAAPGMPCGATVAAAEKLNHRLLHDPLQTGVACMLVNAIKKHVFT